MELVLGGDPTTSEAGIAPKVDSSVGGNLVISFKRSDASELAPAIALQEQLSDHNTFTTPADDITMGAATAAGPIPQVAHPTP